MRCDEFDSERCIILFENFFRGKISKDEGRNGKCDISPLEYAAHLLNCKEHGQKMQSFMIYPGSKALKIGYDKLVKYLREFGEGE